ncbi:type I restriction enzyme S subunit [Mycoplana sp. BE70]|uniref:restriction endonuclease subunit S n=1 Tax=Mycoplana sp. BE70 TaxID=2817775 RepID=UPI00285E1CF5|nr:restriction endonuclease subunit S [Mycoplana sp. BE70]MDR6758766.1 type I restriction enzyme S subunit [Mycoplana sp. BE70]
MKQVRYPESWGHRRLKFIADVKTSNVDKHVHDDEIPVRLCNYTDVYYNRVITDDMELSAGSVTLHELNRFGLRRGQVLMTKDSESWDDIAVPAYVSQDMPEVVCGYHLAMVEPLDDELDGEFFCWAAQTHTINDHYKLEARGVTRFGLGHYALKNVEIGFPSKDRQRAINAFLRNKTAEIDHLIAKKLDLLGLLAEKRSALITRAVTKGLDPTAPMKSSGIDWLGDIPAHWDSTFRLKFLTTVSGGLTPATANADYWRGDIPWVSPKDMKVFDIADSEDHVTELALEETSLSLIDPGAVLFVVRGMILAHTFPIAVNSVAVTVNQDMKALRCGDRLTPKFLAYFLRGIDRHILSLVETSAHGTKALRSESWREVNVPLPPREEQFTILAKIDDGLAEIDKSEALIRSAIDQLTEYRAAIITKAVTGELEVT